MTEVADMRKLAPCGCHKTSGEEDATFQRMTAPMDQCIACAQKHMDQAYSAYFEFCYRRENRRFIRGQLRAVVNHTYKRWPDIAKQARRLALLLQQGNDNDKDMELLANSIDDVFDAENPGVNVRLNTLDAINHQEA